MFAKRLLQKAMHQPSPQHDAQHGGLNSSDLDLQIALHYGIPHTASILAFDPVQRLLAIGTLDGRIKVIGADNIEVLLVSPKKLPYKNLEFLCNRGFLVGVSNENDIQVWDLENRHLTYALQWEFHITAFSIIHGTYLMYVGDEEGSVSVLKYDAGEGKIVRLSYHIPVKALSEAATISLPTHQSVVGILPQPSTFGNRVLIAYENGVIILWDISENRVVAVRGYSDLHLKGDEVVDSPTRAGAENQGDTSDYDQHEKEICSLCWASSNGSILAVGYMDGDILLWNISSGSNAKGQQARTPSNDVVKLQLSSGSRRLPVIVLHWSPDIKSNNECGGQLFIYGGDDIGSEEVLTVLSLDWPSGKESINCVARVDLTLNGSFADMILIPKSGITEKSSSDAVFVLTNPGQLHVYDGSVLSILKSQEEISSVKPENFPVTVPIIYPLMTVTKLCLIPTGGNYLKALLEKGSSRIGATPALSAGTKWPLTGGVLSDLSFAEDIGIERIYVAGYQDGSVRIWDATYPVLKLMSVLEEGIKEIEVAGESSSVSALDFCPTNFTLAIGYESGLVRIYKIHERAAEPGFHFLSETKNEVHAASQVDGNVHCTAVFSVVNSPVQTVHFAHSGARLAVGYKCGKVVMLDVNSKSLLFNEGYSSGSNSGIICITTKTVPQTLISSSKNPSPQNTADPAAKQEALFILTRDSHVFIADSMTGNMISPRSIHPKKERTAISMHIIGGAINAAMATQKDAENLRKDIPLQSETKEGNQLGGVKAGIDKRMSNTSSCFGESLSDSFLLICCEHVLRLHSLKSVIQGDSKCFQKEKLPNPCCWSSTFKLKDDNTYGVILLYRTGVLEIRSLPDLELLEESSLMSILRWSFKVNMERTLSFSGTGHISLVNGCELAFVSIFSGETGLRTPESLPCLHDKVLAAAADAAINLSMFHKKKQGASSRLFDGILKGFKGGRTEHGGDVTESATESTFVQQLEKNFSRTPFLDPSLNVPKEEEGEEKELSIDDIEIDDPVPVASTSSVSDKHKRKDERKEREKLLQGATADKPRLRTTEEILTQYKFGGDAAAAAAHAQDKLLQRQEKLQKISERTEELQNRAEDFKSMADELVKTMENRKWWRL